MTVDDRLFDLLVAVGCGPTLIAFGVAIEGTPGMLRITATPGALVSREATELLGAEGSLSSSLTPVQNISKLAKSLWSKAPAAEA